ncbi:GvpL/GvpF family gas vesicle protein [Nonomuraea sp. KM90]|uniref:GvpL/GvpF family gas vesicle protein n=1 Tax=Nonomuraea sp. KM90 TaxID=3457428 RepID=UPI003FCD01CE
MAEEGQGTYLYAVARDSYSECPPGVAGASVRALSRNGLVAYVSTVPLDQFGEEPLRRSLEDLDWLAETARAHHRVVDAVAAATTTAPVRLVTVYEDDGQVGDLLDRRGDDFLELLDQVTGRREWGVKAYAVPAADSRTPDPTADAGHAGRQATGDGHAGREGTGDGHAGRPGPGEGHAGRLGTGEGHAGRPGPGDGQAGRPGTAYLQRRRASLRGREQARRQALRRADHIHQALCALAAAGCRHRTQDPRLSGRDDVMLLNGAYLVDEARDAEFAELAGTLGGDGVEIRMTGPWAPYSFTVLEAT